MRDLVKKTHNFMRILLFLSNFWGIGTILAWEANFRRVIRADTDIRPTFVKEAARHGDLALQEQDCAFTRLCFYNGSEMGAPIWEERYVASANSIPSLPIRPWVVGSASPAMHWSQ